METVKNFFVAEGSDEEEDANIAANKYRASADEGCEKPRLPALSSSTLPAVSSRANSPPPRGREGAGRQGRQRARYTSSLEAGPRPLGDGGDSNPGLQTRRYPSAFGL